MRSSQDDEVSTSEQLQLVLLDALCTFPAPQAATAGQFICCRMLIDAVHVHTKEHGKEPSHEVVASLLLHYRQLCDRQLSVVDASSSGTHIAMQEYSHTGCSVESARQSSGLTAASLLL